MPSVTSTSCTDGPIDLGVRPHRADEPGDPPGRLLHLAEERAGRQRAGDPLETRSEGVAVEDRGDALAPVDVGTGGGERRRDAPPVVHVVVGEPVRHRLLAVGDAQRVALGVGGSSSRRRRSSAMNCSAGSERSASRTSDESNASPLLQGVDRARRCRGRVVELVGEPGGHGAEGDQRLALARERVHGADGLEEAFDEVDAEREPRARQLAERRGRHAQHPSRRWHRGRSPGSWSTPFHAWKPPAQSPGRSIVNITTGSAGPARRTSSTRPSSSTHQKSAGSPSRNSSSPPRTRPPRRPPAISAELRRRRARRR